MAKLAIARLSLAEPQACCNRLRVVDREQETPQGPLSGYGANGMY